MGFRGLGCRGLGFRSLGTTSATIGLCGCRIGQHIYTLTNTPMGAYLHKTISPNKKSPTSHKDFLRIVTFEGTIIRVYYIYIFIYIGIIYRDFCRDPP